MVVEGLYDHVHQGDEHHDDHGHVEDVALREVVAQLAHHVVLLEEEERRRAGQRHVGFV